MKTLRLCFIGFGNVAQTVSQLFIDKEDWLEEHFGYRIAVTGIAGRSKGSLVRREGLELSEILAFVRKHGEFDRSSDCFFEGTPEEMMDASGADVMVEMSTLSIADGLPAADYIRHAIQGGKHVITANKGPVAWYYDELRSMAERAGVKFLYETIVLDGTPTFNLMTETLQGNRIEKITGILNGTSNYVLKQLENGAALEEAIAGAQRIGLAEADPSMDIDGWDGAAKICAMANVLMEAHMTPAQVHVESIRDVTEKDLAAARENGMCIKYICRAERSETGIIASVCPEQLPAVHAYATVNGTSAAITLFTDLAGELTIIQTNPGLLQTAYGIYSDLLTLLTWFNKK